MRQSLISRALARTQRSLTWLMVLAYAAALAAPAAGICLRRGTLDLRWGTGSPAVVLTVPSVLLALVLFTAGFQLPLGALPALVRRPAALAVGTVVNALVPLLVLPLLAMGLRLSSDADGGSGLLTGIAMVGAMPVAGGATVWGGRAGGNHTLVVGIVLTSTLLSPLTTPVTLSTAALLARGHYAADLGRMAHAGGGVIAGITVAAPCLAGLLAQRLTPGRYRARALPSLKLITLLAAVALTYSNASGALGAQLLHPQPLFIAASVAAAAATCLAGLACGWGLARALRRDRADAVAITLASGMNNSSAGAVFATTQLPAHPQVLMPILAYSLFQKVGAGAVGGILRPHGIRRVAAAD